MERKNRFKNGGSNENFGKSIKKGFEKSPYSTFWSEQYNLYLKSHWISLVFIFIILALYLNSFYRSLILTLLYLGFSGITGSLYFIIRGIYPIDSLWALILPNWISLSAILLLSRIVDFERLRGNDLGDSLNYVKDHFFHTVVIGLGFLCGSVILIGLGDLFQNNGFSFFKDLIFIGLISSVLGIVAFKYLFYSFYVGSELTFDKIALFLLKNYYQFKRKKSES